MTMKRTVALLLACLLCVSLFAACGNNTEEETPKYDYLVLVNKENRLPADWESVVQLEDAQNTIPEGVELNEDTDYLASDVFKVETKALAAFRALQADLEKDGIIILLDSTYRPVARQEELWKEFEEEYGLEYTQKFVAVPGYSEHHTALAIDVCIVKDGVIINDNDQMTAEKEIFGEIHKRLANYGFILRYPEGKDDITGYGYEPWHFRYIDSPEIAKQIMDGGLTLEEYLGKAPAATEAATEASTEAATEEATEDATEAATQAATEATTNAATNAATAPAAAESAEEDGQNPVMNFIGEYASDRCMITVEASGKSEAKISVHWGSSVSEAAEWTMSGFFDQDTFRVNYGDCEKKIVTYNEDGSVADETIEYDEGVGRIQFHNDGTLTWQDEQEPEHAQMEFSLVV